MLNLFKNSLALPTILVSKRLNSSINSNTRELILEFDWILLILLVGLLIIFLFKQNILKYPYPSPTTQDGDLSSATVSTNPSTGDSPLPFQPQTPSQDYTIPSPAGLRGGVDVVEQDDNHSI
jgi:hypothetical protein